MDMINAQRSPFFGDKCPCPVESVVGFWPCLPSISVHNIYYLIFVYITFVLRSGFLFFVLPDLFSLLGLLGSLMLCFMCIFVYHTCIGWEEELK